VVSILARTCARCGSPFETYAKEYLCSQCRKPHHVSNPRSGSLTRREQQIVTLIKQAKANKQIAYELCLAEGTVKEYLFRIFRKLNVSNRTELALSKMPAE
jgi:DNA-binding NarL/FixJ family response regulator